VVPFESLLLKGDARRSSAKLVCLPSCESLLKILRHLVQLLAIRIIIANSVHSSVSGLLFTTCSCWQWHYEQILNLWRSEHFWIIIFHSSIGRSAMKAPSCCKLRQGYLTGIACMGCYGVCCAVWTKLAVSLCFFIPTAQWIFMTALGIRILIANSCTRYRGIIKGLSTDGRQVGFS